MIKVQEFRLGNMLLQKQGTRILPVRCNVAHWELMARNEVKELFPVVVNADWLQKCGFEENQKYALLPEAREFILLLPLPGSAKQELRFWIKNNKECFGRLLVDGQAASRNLHHLHELQNLYQALAGEELAIRL